jgi:hypothetical protein
MTTVLAAIMAMVLAVIHPAAISAIIPSNVPAAWVSIRPVTRVRSVILPVRPIVGAHITVIGPIRIPGNSRRAVISA